MKIKNPAAVAMGKLSRANPSPAQNAASVINGKKGGRPRRKYILEEVLYTPWKKLLGDRVAAAVGRKMMWVRLGDDLVLLIDHKGKREVVSGPATDQRIRQGW